MSSEQNDKILPDEDSETVSESAANTDLAFLELDENGTVDLDALFDALNIAAEEGNGAMEFGESGQEGAGTLTISGTDLTLGNVSSEDLPDATDLYLKSNIVSDES